MNVNLNLNSVRSTLQGLWDELVDRRLWPVALVLVVAIVAVPVLLSKPAEEPPAPPVPPAATGAGPGVAFQPAISTEGKKSSEIRKKVRRFTRKNPFTPQGLNLTAAASAGTAQPTTGTASAGGTVSSPADLGSITGGTSGSGSGTSGSSGSSGSTGSTGSTGTSTETFYYHYTVDVRFGKAGEEDTKTLSEFRALPSSENPVLVFMGVKNDGKSAVFLISANSTTTGDGDCAPSDTECTFLYMKKGDEQTIEAIDTDGAITTYTLELRDIDVKRTTGPEAAGSSRDARSSTQRGERTRLRRVVHSIRTLGL